MEELEHGELEQRLVELQEGEHDGEVHVVRVVGREHVRGHPGHRLAHHLHQREPTKKKRKMENEKKNTTYDTAVDA